MVLYNFKKIQPVPTGKDMIDIVLTRTQRKTPTVCHKGWAIQRLRQFYMRKVKFTQTTWNEKLSQILEDFPQLDDIHPFYSDLCNVLYDRDHYKLALGQLSTARTLIDNISKDYVRLLKYGDSLYRCKQLKRAALGRMCTLMKKNAASLGYLEEVRKHLARLPSIDPNTRCILICGYPNVGKSSFMNKITRANVDVQPYAFTTKSLFVGHMDYKYLRWQVIDTPGILDHPLEDRNTIEMCAITALAHLQCAVLYFIDFSEMCGFSVGQQMALFDNIKPLFANKPLLVVASKSDSKKLEDLDTEERAEVDAWLKRNGAQLESMSSHLGDGVSHVKTKACEMLLEKRVAVKMGSNKMANILNKVTVATPKGDAPQLETCIPASVLAERRRRRADDEDDEDEGKEAAGADGDMEDIDGSGGKGGKRKTQKDLMWEKGGPGVYAQPWEEHYKGMLAAEEWTTDIIPQIMDGKNIADFVDADIEAKLAALEAEEEALEAETAMGGAGAGTGEDDPYGSDIDEEERALVKEIRSKKKLIQQRAQREKNKNRPVVPRKFRVRRQARAEFAAGLADTGAPVADQEAVAKKVAGVKRGRSLTRLGKEEDMESTAMEDVGEGGAGAATRSRSKSRTRSQSQARAAASRATAAQRGLKDMAQVREVKKLKRGKEYRRNKMARAGEADRHGTASKPKWLLAGKRGNGTTRSR